jgi:solute carrier family 41
MASSPEQRDSISSFANLVRADSLDYGGLSSSATINADTGKREQPFAADSSDMEVFAAPDSSHLHQAEPSMVLFFQVLFPFLIAGMGMVCAGILLDYVQHWELFKVRFTVAALLATII